MPHKHSVYDTDMHFRIDAETRAIINQSQVRKKLIQYDHKSERLTFELPKEIDGHDMSLCDKIEIHYMNVGSNVGEVSADMYVVDDKQISKDDTKVVIFSWLIGSSATVYAGSLTFMIRFLCHDSGLITYSWGTDMYKGISVGEAYNNGDMVGNDNLFEVTAVPRMTVLDSAMIVENASRPFSDELHQALINTERVYVENPGNESVSPIYYLSANAYAQFNPWGYESKEEMCNAYAAHGWTPETVKLLEHYKEATVDGKTTYHPRLFSVVARTLDGAVRGTINDKSSDDTLTNHGFVKGKLSLKIDKNSISASDTTPHYNQDKVLYRAKNGGAYSGIPVAVESVVNDQGVAAQSIPRFNGNSELIGSTSDTSSDGTEEKDADGNVTGYTNGALVNKGYAKNLIKRAIKDHNHDDAYAAKAYSFANFANQSGTDDDENAGNGYHVLSFGDKAKSLYAVRVAGSSSISSSIAQRLADGSLRAKMRASTSDNFADSYDATTLINYEYLNHRLSSYDGKVKLNPEGTADIPQRSAEGEIRCNMPEAISDQTVVNKKYLFDTLSGYAKTSDIPSLDGYAKTDDIPTDEHINDLIDTALGGILNGEY